MSESTLKITHAELSTELGRYLGIDRDEDNWTANEVLDVEACKKRGLRQFYFPPRVNQDEQAHSWSFLRPQSVLWIWDDVIEDDEITISSATYADPVTTITASDDVFYPSMEEKTLTCVTSGNTYVIDQYISATQVKVTGDAHSETGVITIDSEDLFTMPWDFGGMAGDGNFTYDVDESRISVIKLTSDVRIRLLRQATISTGTPGLAAIVPLITDGTQGQRWAAMFHNPPDKPYKMHYRYYILPNALVDTTLEYPYGSAMHSETILESCLAIAESREKDLASVEHQNKYALLLQSSIDRDKKLSESIVHYGYNRDGSDGIEEDHGQRNFNSLVTFNGA